MGELVCWIRSGDGIEAIALGPGFGSRPSRGRLKLVGGSCAILGLLLLLTVQFLLVGFWIWSMGLSCLAGSNSFKRIVILALYGVILYSFRLLALPVVEAVGGGVNLVAGNTYTRLWATLCCCIWVVVPCLLGVCSRFKVWDPGKVWMPGFVGSIVLVFQDSDFMAGGALLKFILNHILDLGLFNCLSKNKHTQLRKFRL